jgi:hypothetical protein
VFRDRTLDQLRELQVAMENGRWTMDDGNANTQHPTSNTRHPAPISYTIDPVSLSFQPAFYHRIATSETFAFLLRIHNGYKSGT